MSADDDYVLVELHPFAHQVGGHTCVLELNSSVVCKPFESKEVWFYENEPDEMKEFTPRFLGEVDVKCDMVSPKKSLLACLPRNVAVERGLVTFDPPNVVQPSYKRNRKRKHQAANSLTTPGQKNLKCNTTENTTEKRDDYVLEVWSIQCIERQISRYGFWANNKPQKFIMLENLVRKYRKPCMLDLKMGRRQYGDDSTSEKRKLLEERCANSTSSSLGFRICGTQVYQAATESYIVHNKYHGRNLSVEGVHDELALFFTNGDCLRTDAIKLVIEKLERLKKLLETQKTFYFFSCSLLLMYDGVRDISLVEENYSSQAMEGPSAENNYRCTNVDVRLIDFAHASARSSVTSENEADEGILFGIENLISNLTSILEYQEVQTL